MEVDGTTGNKEIVEGATATSSSDASINPGSSGQGQDVSNDDLCLTLQELQKKISSDNPDVVIKRADGECKAHKIFLTKRSDYFQRMFESGMKEAVENRIEIPYLTKSAVGWLLWHIYVGPRPLGAKFMWDADLSDLFDLFEVADMFGLPALKGLAGLLVIHNEGIKNNDTRIQIVQFINAHSFFLLNAEHRLYHLLKK